MRKSCRQGRRVFGHLGRTDPLKVGQLGRDARRFGEAKERNRISLEETAADIKNEVREANLRLLSLDLQDFSSVRQAANEVNSYKENINVLFNNAGQMATPFKMVENKLESQFAGNVSPRCSLIPCSLHYLAQAYPMSFSF